MSWIKDPISEANNRLRDDNELLIQEVERLTKERDGEHRAFEVAVRDNNRLRDALEDIKAQSMNPCGCYIVATAALRGEGNEPAEQGGADV